MTRAIVVMGVSGSGKTTLGQALAARLGLPFIEGDSLHPASNIAKMAAGQPLDDADRLPFLENVANTLTAHRETGSVVSCSALKRSYRDLLRARAGDILFVLPVVDRAALAARLARRSGHFMPASLLDSQLEALEALQPDESGVTVDGDATTDAQLSRVLAALDARRA